MPLMPIAQAALDAGWSVLFAAPAESAGPVEAGGVPFQSLHNEVPGDDPRRGQVYGQLAAVPKAEQGFFFSREIFGRLNTTGLLTAAREVVRAWRPDVIVSDAGECAGGLAAEEAGILWVRVHPGLSGSDGDGGLAAGVAELRAELGLPADGDGFLRRAPRIAYMPASLDAGHKAASVLRLRDPRYVPPAQRDPDGPVFVTLGTEAAGMPFFHDLMQGCIDGVEQAGRRCVAVVGRHADPATFRRATGSSVTSWVDQGAELRRASATICHGGSGSVLAALGCAVPMIIIPLFADQPANADALASARAALVVDPGPRPREPGDAFPPRQLDPQLPARLVQCLGDLYGTEPAGLAAVHAELAAHAAPTAALDLLVTAPTGASVQGPTP